MFINQKILFIPAILSCCLLLVAWTDSWEQIRRESGHVQSVQARFIQKKHMKILSRPFLSEGRFFFQAPASVRWEYTSPVRSILLMHGGSLKRYIHSGDKFAQEAGGSLSAMEVIMQEISAWLHGRFDQSQHFAAALVHRPTPAIILTPREKSFTRLIKRIELTPSEQPGVLKSILIVEDEKTTTLFEFRHVQVNQPIPESVFQAVP
ncbi:MAG: outer membrane lipoprotein carrier protein LolA [Syntrophales bacterium]|nr:outer membrane lipoprotein carrier protein LolA [Syntrophales bacterium]